MTPHSQHPQFILRDSEVWDGPSWSTMVDVQPGWQDLLIPFSSLVPVVRTRSIPEGQRTPLALDRISAIQVQDAGRGCFL